MARQYKQVESDTQVSSSKSDCSIDWRLCILCQKETQEQLQCPANSKRKDIGAGYKYVSENLRQFHEIGSMPVDIRLEQLDAGNGIEATLIENTAAWHKTCRNKISSLNLERALKRKNEASKGPSPIKTRRCSSDSSQKEHVNTCIFCDNIAGSAGLHKASTFELDFKVRKCATELNDSRLLTKLAGGDMVAIDAQYHTKCLAKLYKSAQQLKKDTPGSVRESSLYGIAFAELISHIETFRDSTETSPVFSMTELRSLYSRRLEKLGIKSPQIHTTRLKNRILAAVPDLRAHSQGRDVLLAFDKDIGAALKQVCNQDFDSEALILAKAAKIVRRDIFGLKQTFIGRFPTGCQEASVTASLTALISMILDGPGIEDESTVEQCHSCATQTLSQLIVYNTVKSRRNKSTSTAAQRHNRDRETPVPIYLALKIHGETRKRGLVDAMHAMGLCISYDRMLTISTDIANQVCDKYEKEGVVCPPQLSKQVFTTAAVDNIDHNPSSTTATDSFHGTSISVMQHPTVGAQGIPQEVPVLNENVPKRKKISAIPACYMNIPPSALTKKDPFVPPTTGQTTPEATTLSNALAKEYEWLEHVQRLIRKSELAKDDFLSWAAFHASVHQPSRDPPTAVALLPLFEESAHSVAMIKHSMDVVKATIQHLNPGQVPVLVMDQPLFAIAKTIQWNFPETHGEDCFLIMFGGLHIEIAAFRVLGDWLEGSGWTTAIQTAGIATSGVADSLIKVTHLTRARHAHQVTVAALFTLMHQAFDKYREAVPTGETPMDIKAWCEKMSAEQPQFKYWSTVLEMELCILRLVGSIRRANFGEYLESLGQLLPWMFSMDHVNYSRWLSVHVRDLCLLSDKHPAIYQEFCSGKFVAHKSRRPFSAMALDHAHEQVNALVKGDGGAVGLTNNPSALRRWMVAGPEICRMIREFEESTCHEDPLKHHEQTPAAQVTFAKEVANLISTIDDMGNPFSEDSGDLLTLDTKDIMDPAVVKTVNSAFSVGQKQYDLFVKERFVHRSKPITEPIKKNKLPLFARQKPPLKQKSQLAILKDDCVLFSRLYIACQSREGNLEDFFKHENQPWPPSLCKLGEMRSGNKADLLVQLEAQAEPVDTVPKATAMIIDGAVTVQMLSPRTSKTFKDYIDTVYMPFVQQKLEHVDRLDIVWDTYIPDSLKAATRAKRGTGLRRRITPTSAIPSNWQSFLRVDENKTQLFHLLAEQVTVTEIEGKEVYSTFDDRVLCTSNTDKSHIEPCTQEEADTRLVLHLSDAANKGHQNITVRTADTDVVVIIVSNLHLIPVSKVWISFGVGKHHRYIAAHEIAASLGPCKAKSLAVFHAFTGCDVTSFFAGKGKKSAWDAWNVFPDVTDAFLMLANSPPNIPDNILSHLEKFVVLLYDRMSGLSSVNEARQHLFSRKSRALESIPPTQAALTQHTLRAAYQGGHVWGQVLTKDPQLPNPGEWGWERLDETSWKPKWTTLDQAQQKCYELIHCSCKKACRGLCKCNKASLKCTALCHCEGNCFQDI